VRSATQLNAAFRTARKAELEDATLPGYKQSRLALGAFGLGFGLGARP
jgi:hypothetical protein